jgi:pre-mRNA-splicing factor CDC5/CEF1
VVDDDNAASKNLLSESTTPLRSCTPLRTPRVQGAEDNILAEARNLRALSSMQTPLLGEDVADVDTSVGTGFEGATPRRTTFQTPRAIPAGSTPSRTPGVGSSSFDQATPLRTPYRDQLSINVRDEEDELDSEERRLVNMCVANSRPV